MGGDRFDARQVLSRTLELQAQVLAGREMALPEDIETEFSIEFIEAAERQIPTLSAFQLGADTRPRPMSGDEMAALGDYFTTHVLQVARPMTLSALAQALDDVPAEFRLAKRDLFAIAEGAAFAAEPEAEKLATNARLVFVWRHDDDAAPDVMLSTVAEPDDPTALLQLIAWSEKDGAYHYFERSRDGAGWLWAGNSFHALVEPTRGKGPFDSHVNGSLVMKELRFPWPHWHTQADGIPRSVLFPDGVRDHPLFATVAGAEDLENVVRQGVRRWTTSRIHVESESKVIDNFHRFARQLTTTTSVNLISSDVNRELVATTAQLALPLPFFVDTDGLERALEEVDPGKDGDGFFARRTITVAGSAYQAELESLGSELVDGAGHKVAGDSHFAFMVPERAFEDIFVGFALMDAGVVSPRLMLCLLMVDFPNPVFSPRRASLAKFFPERVHVGDAARLDADFEAALRRQESGAPAVAEFLRWWGHADDLADAARARLAEYIDSVNRRLGTPGDIADLLRLAESRRRAFRRRPLAEFPHSVPRLEHNPGRLVMTTDGHVVSAQEG